MIRSRRPSPVLLCVVLAAIVLAAAAGIPPARAAERESRDFRLPPHVTFRLENGLTVSLMEQHQVPLITAIALFPAGAARDAGMPGLAYLTAEALLFGTRTRTKAQIEDRLEFLGARYYAWADLETAGVFFSFMSADRDAVLPLMRDVIRDPAFDPAEFAKRKKRLLLELVQQKERPSAVVDAYFNRFLFGPHGYGNPVYGTRASVKNITRLDAKAFYDRHYRPEDSVLAIVGDFETEDMRRRIEGLFSSWRPRGRPTVLEQPPLPRHDRSRVLLVNKDDATETQFAFGGFGIPRNHPDYIAVRVVNAVLGGRFTSMLNDALRVSEGLTYGASSTFNTYRDAGSFVISSFTSTENTFKAVDLALAVLERLHEQGVDEKTLESAKAYLVGQFPTSYETPGSLANLLAAMFFYGFDESDVNGFRQRVEGVDVQKAREIIARHFPRERLQFVLIGKAAALRGRAGRYGELTEKEIKADGF
ncbi:MAG: Peptidase M16 inactive domain protein [Syntrophaceae bacterium PtaU1.Bin231]|nr:MAG: Peptidase M16 inactive domain protein [Syntrophaceae bacterium PtaU1.Bin231]